MITIEVQRSVDNKRNTHFYITRSSKLLVVTKVLLPVFKRLLVERSYSSK